MYIQHYIQLCPPNAVFRPEDTTPSSVSSSVQLQAVIAIPEGALRLPPHVVHCMHDQVPEDWSMKEY